jgi:TatD DNase family protein
MTPALFDTHCHLQDPRFQGRLPGVLERARRAGVGPMVCCATREEDWDPVLDLARDHPEVLPMLGQHPWFADRARPGWEERLERRLGQARAGVGECGLDFAPGRPDRPVQEAVLVAQLRLARRLALPISLHCVRAWGRLTELLRREGVPSATVLHAFSGSAETARILQDLGLHLSFSAVLARPGATRVQAAAAAADPDRLLLETDAPDLAPPGVQGDNEPAHLPRVAEAAARIRGVSPEILAGQTRANALRVFRALLETKDAWD